MSGAPFTFVGITAVVRASSTAHLLRLVDTLIEERITNIEFTLTTPGVLEFLEQNGERWSKTAALGVGTVLTAEQAEQSIDAGAEFLVTPALRPAVSAVAAARRMPIAIGAMTPSEVLTAHESGADIVKVFPASTVGADYLAHLRGPMPWLKAMPSGGIRLEDIPAWMAAGAIGVSLGSPLLGKAPDTGEMSTLIERARRANTLINEVPS